MSKSYITGFPRIGEQRELKFALERYWSKKCTFEELEEVAKELQKRHWNYQKKANIDLISVNDFSYYDLILDTIILFDCAPARFDGLEGNELYFALARGDEQRTALEMTKWFNTNYHYIVPELDAHTTFGLNAKKIFDEYREAKECGITPKINLIGPITFLALSKTSDKSSAFTHLDLLVAQYEKLLKELEKIDNEIIIQIDEPIFVTDRANELKEKITPVYNRLSSVSQKIKIIFMTYFEHATEAVEEIVKTKVWGVGIDFIYSSHTEESVEIISKSDKVLFAGVVDGRNIWVNNIEEKSKLISSLEQKLENDRLFIGTSCSLLHVPYSLEYEAKLNIKEWLSFALEKLLEVDLLTKISNNNISPQDEINLKKNVEAINARKTSAVINDTNVQNRVKNLTKFSREGSFKERIKVQKEILNLPSLPTTTIGSFPQTQELRQVRNAYKKALITEEVYEQEIKKYIDECIEFQEECKLDVLVHGEPERNDMVEYFGEQLKGYAFSKNGWVQSYGSRCVKPPLLYGDVSRPKPMTVKWINYAQSKTEKIVKGMLTGPITILNWSFVRDDKPRQEIAKELALCIYDEIDDLQKESVKIIQVDEAAFKEGYPLRKENIPLYEAFALECFKLSVSAAKPSTQIHTHMCYSDFNDIIKTIEAMDADVISIETARSGNKLLKVFESVGYKQEVGPGVYDIHSPRVPSVEEIAKQIYALLEVLPARQLWINPDCGLKTRKWDEVKSSIKNMTTATKIVRLG